MCANIIQTQVLAVLAWLLRDLQLLQVGQVILSRLIDATRRLLL